MITIQANDIEVQLRLLKRKYKRKKRWAGSTPSPAHSPLPCPYDPGDPESPAALTSHQRSHIKQSIVEASAAGWCDTGLSAAQHPGAALAPLANIDNNNLPSGVRITPDTLFLLMFLQRAEISEHSLFIKYSMYRCFIFLFKSSYGYYHKMNS